MSEDVISALAMGNEAHWLRAQLVRELGSGTTL